MSMRDIVKAEIRERHEKFYKQTEQWYGIMNSSHRATVRCTRGRVTLSQGTDKR